MTLRRSPEVQFLFDQSVAAQDRVEQILYELKQEEAARAAATASDGAPARDRDTGARSTDGTPRPSPTSDRRSIASSRTSAPVSASSCPRTSGPMATPLARPSAWRSRFARSARRPRSSWTRRRRTSCSRFPPSSDIRIAREVSEATDGALDHGVQLARSHRRDRPRSIAGAQHRSSRRQHALRRDQLGRRVGGGVQASWCSR